MKEGRPIEWLYRGTQLANVLFHTSHHVKFIVNARHPECYAPGKVADKAHKLYPPADQFLALDRRWWWMCHSRCRWRIWRRSGTGASATAGAWAADDFEWKNFRPIYKKDVGRKVKSGDPLDSVGEMIARKSRSDFVSHIVLQDLGI